MPRKTNGSSTTTRSKKITAQTQPSQAQPARVETTPVQVVPQVSKEVPSNGKMTATPATSGFVASTIEDQIRHRAYELYLERRATAGDASGNQNDDWLIAEREIRSRQQSRAQSA